LIFLYLSLSILLLPRCLLLRNGEREKEKKKLFLDPFIPFIFISLYSPLALTCFSVSMYLSLSLTHSLSLFF
jgi:hypothetical protein